jgi:serine/threonine protein kinase
VLIKEGDKNYIQTRLPVQAKEYEAWKGIILDTKTSLNHEFLLLPEHTGFQHDKELCSTTGTAIVIYHLLQNNYPYFPINLAEEIASRKPDNASFKESELWYLLYALVAAKVNLGRHGYQVGDIKPQNVFINSEHRVKVVNLLTSSRQTSAFTKAKNYESIALLLAPEDFPELVRGAIDNKNNQQSEVFAIGATLLCAGLLDDDLSTCYNFEKY